MSKQTCEVSRRLHDLEMQKAFVVRQALKNGDVYFGQPPILDWLFSHNACTQNEIANGLNVSPASVAVSLRRMQKSGIVEKTVDENDLRRNLVSLTEKGKAQQEFVHKCFEDIDRKLFAGFGEEELQTLSDMLKRLCDNLAPELPAGKDVHTLLQEECFKEETYHGEID